MSPLIASTRWLRLAVDRLAECVPAGYDGGAAPASEPTALAGLALLAHGREEAAGRAARWLADEQSRNGSVGVAPSRPTPCWPTALAMLLWHSVDRRATATQFRDPLRKATEWTLADHGKAAPRSTQFGHDSTLIGWSWAPDTHSWLEPTALFVLALKAVGHAQHPRTREGVRLLLDRQLPSGGCNYGNTIVLGQELLPHVEPTGVAMLALAGEADANSRIERSLAYLQRELCGETATASLGYGLLGLAAHRRVPPARDAWLRSAYERLPENDPSPFKLALVALAAAAQDPLRPS
jgi:hypothetical protein